MFNASTHETFEALFLMERGRLRAFNSTLFVEHALYKKLCIIFREQNLEKFEI